MIKVLIMLTIVFSLLNLVVELFLFFYNNSVQTPVSYSGNSKKKERKS